MFLTAFSQICLSISSKFAYKNSSYLTGFDLLFANSVLLVPIYSYLAIKRKVSVFNLATKSNTLLLTLRVLFGVSGTLLLFYSFKYASIGEAILVYNINPLIVIILGGCILCESVRVIEIILVVGAFVGVFMISHVTKIEGDARIMGIYIALCAAFTDGCSFVFMRKLNEKEKIHWLISPFYLSSGYFVYSVFSYIMFSGTLNIFKYTTLDIFLLLLLSIFEGLFQLFLSIAYKYE